MQNLNYRYCPNVLPSMKESDLENHISEVRELQEKLRDMPVDMEENHGVKRTADEQISGQRPNYYYFRHSKSYQTTFH